jgi:protein-disulfide isomerase
MLPTFLARVNVARVRTALDLVASVAMILAAVAMMWFVFRDPPAGAAAAPPPRQTTVPGQPITLDGALKLGNPRARVAVIEFVDYQCTYCATFARDVMPAIEARYVKSGKIMFAIRHLPIDRIHPFARRAAAASVCAAQQGKFSEMHKLLFDPEPTLDDVGIVVRANKAGVNVDQLHACIATDGTRIVSADSEMAAALGLRGTPTLMVGQVGADRRVKVDKAMFGASSVEELSRVIDEALASTAVRVQ